MELPDPVGLAAELREVLAEVVDPRKRRGARHGLAVVLTTAVCAVAAAAGSFDAVGPGTHDQVGRGRRGRADILRTQVDGSIGR
ncbi:MAG: transposase family protein [Pseudonocardia sp.]|nr:transposase family protein [Pseudonocardia sp.]